MLNFPPLPVSTLGTGIHVAFVRLGRPSAGAKAQMGKPRRRLDATSRFKADFTIVVPVEKT